MLELGEKRFRYLLGIEGKGPLWEDKTKASRGKALEGAERFIGTKPGPTFTAKMLDTSNIRAEKYRGDPDKYAEKSSRAASMALRDRPEEKRAARVDFPPGIVAASEEMAPGGDAGVYQHP